MNFICPFLLFLLFLLQLPLPVSCTSKPLPKIAQQPLIRQVTPSPSPTKSPRARATPTKSPKASATPTKSPKASATPTKSPRASATPTKSPKASATPTKSPRASATPTKSPRESATPTKSPRASATPTKSPKASVSNPIAAAPGTQRPEPSVEASSTNVGAIVGGVVGGIAALVLIALVARVATRRPVMQGPADIDFQETQGGGPSYIDAAVEGRISATRQQEGSAGERHRGVQWAGGS